MRRQRYPKAPTVGERFMYAFIGLVSGGLLSTLTIAPFCLYVFPPLTLPVMAAFTGLMVVWGFFGTESMTDMLSYWWDEFISSRRGW